MTKEHFITDVKTIRDRARKQIEQGAVTEGYGCDREKIVALLNEVLATEIVCTLRYRNHYYLAAGINSGPVADEFLQHANEEAAHADKVSERIVQLNGKPNWSPDGLLTRSHAEYVAGESLTQMIKENLVAERIAIDTYREIILFIGDRDPTTRRLLEDILAQEEEHAEELASLLG